MELKDLADSLDYCLGCRACETVCPTNVEYGRLYESAMVALEQTRKRSWLMKGLRKLFFEQLIPKKKRMNVLANLLWLYQKTGMQTLVRKGKLSNYLPNHLGDFEAIMDPLPSPKERRRFPKKLSPRGEMRYRVAFFTGCVMDVMFKKINLISMELLSQAGCEVVEIEQQTCCGALHAHAGEIELAKALAKQNIAVFEQGDYDFIVNNAGGCGAHLISYDHLLAEEPEWRERSKQFVKKVRDISQVLTMCGGIKALMSHNKELNPSANEQEIVTYQPSCHLSNVQQVRDEPVQLLKDLPGVTYQPMPKEEHCCGSAGIYNLVHFNESMDILDAKMKNVNQTHAHTIVTTNPGCLIQMKLGIVREGLQHRMRAIHLVELVAEKLGMDHG